MSIKKNVYVGRVYVLREIQVFDTAFCLRSERGEQKREAFWSKLSRCVEERKRDVSRKMVNGDLNTQFTPKANSHYPLH